MKSVNDNLETWLEEFAKPQPLRAKDHLPHIPSDKLRDEYVNTISARDEKEVRDLLRNLLIISGASQRDVIFAQLLKESGRTPETEYEKRLYAWHTGNKQVAPWEGITWVLDLLPWQPNEAIQVIDAYFYAHAQELPDVWIYALDDVTSIIRAYYLGLPTTTEEAVKMLLDLSSRDFEHLVDELYHEVGYATQLTPAQKDGGRDVIATRKDKGHTSNIRIECKNWQAKVDVEVVRALYGVIEDEKVDKGIVIGVSGFTEVGEETAAEFAARNPRLELMPGSEFVKLLSKTFGRRWTRDINKIIRHSKQRYSETLEAETKKTSIV